MPEEKKNSMPAVAGVVIVVLAVAVYGYFKYAKKDSSAVVNTPVTQEVPTVPSDTNTGTPVSQNQYKDGQYEAVGEYQSPAGAESLKVNLTLKDDMIVDVTATVMATKRESVEWQKKFVSGLKSAVMGKKLSEVNLTKVSGSSLTPKGWNDAVAKILVQAKA